MTLRIILTDGDGIQGLAATFGAVIQTNIIQTAADAAAAAASASQAATSATNASNSAGAASASASSAATSASNASGSASAAAGSATAAGTSATNASNSASAASGSASAASTSATNAATSATNASNSATAAATSASNAAATLANALTKANNLSDVTSAATARTNLAVPGLATANVFTNDQTYQKASPTLVLSDTAQSSGNGIFRMRSITNVWNFQRNTAVAGDFSTLTTPLQVAANDSLILSQTPTFPTAAAGDSSTNGATTAFVAAALAPMTGKNRVINGIGLIAQRGNVAFGVNAGGYGGPDRWVVQNTTTGGAITQNQGGMAINGVTHPDIAQIVSTVPTSLASGNFLSGIAQIIEGYNCFDMMGQPAALSFWFFGTVTGLYNVSLQGGSGNFSYVTQFNYTTASTPQLVTIKIPTIPTAMNIPTSNGVGMTLRIGALNTGTFQSTVGNLNTWQSGTFISGPGAVNWAATVNNIIAATLVQLETGSVPTPFDRRSYGQELALCQRYFVASGAQTNLFGYSTTAGSQFFTWFGLPMPMRATPTVVASWGSGVNASGGAFRMADSRTAESYIQSGTAGGVSAVATWTSFSAEL